MKKGALAKSIFKVHSVVEKRLNSPAYINYAWKEKQKMCVCENCAEKEDSVSVSDNRKVLTKWFDGKNRIIYSICIRAIRIISNRLIEREHKVDRQIGKNWQTQRLLKIFRFFLPQEPRKLMRKVFPLVYFSSPQPPPLNPIENQNQFTFEEVKVSDKSYWNEQ